MVWRSAQIWCKLVWRSGHSVAHPLRELVATAFLRQQVWHFFQPCDGSVALYEVVNTRAHIELSVGSLLLAKGAELVVNAPAV